MMSGHRLFLKDWIWRGLASKCKTFVRLEAILTKICRSRDTLKKEYKESKPALGKSTQNRPKADELNEANKPVVEDEDLNELDEDDLAFGSGDSDDELSVMSGFDPDEAISDENLSVEDDLSTEDFGSASELDESESGEFDEEEVKLEDLVQSRVRPKATKPKDSGYGSDIEGGYALKASKQRPATDPDSKMSSKLPIKLANGRMAPNPKGLLDEPTETFTSVKASGNRVAFAPINSDQSDKSSEEEVRPEAPQKQDPFGQRFGRPAVRTILETKDPGKRLEWAKTELSHLGNGITSDPETSVRVFSILSQGKFIEPTYS